MEYQEGKIYKIIGSGLTYYGSTKQTLKQRLAIHKCNTKCNSKQIIELGNYKIVLIELFPCNTKKELLNRERWFIENNECINKKIPLRTFKEYYIDNIDKFKQYRIDNVDKSKQYRIDNVEKLKENNKQYRIDNVDNKKHYDIDNANKIKEYNKQYRIDNANKIKEYKKQYYLKKKNKIIIYRYI
jgi:hypothetical protein